MRINIIIIIHTYFYLQSTREYHYKLAVIIVYQKPARLGGGVV